MLCPNCNKSFEFTSNLTTTEIEGCTANCPHCGALLLMRGGIALDFHATLHAKDSRWPKDGAGTGYVSV